MTGGPLTEAEVLQASAYARQCGCTTLQLRTLRRVWRGEPVAVIAASDGVQPQAVAHRLRAAIRRIDAGPGKLTEKQQEAVDLRLAGHAWSYIGRRLAITPQAAMRRVSRARPHLTSEAIERLDAVNPHDHEWTRMLRGDWEWWQHRRAANRSKLSYWDDAKHGSAA